MKTGEETAGKKPRRWVKSLIDFVGITFSVLLAFMLNEWRINSRSQADLDTAKASIHAELSDNYAELQRVRDYHLSLYRRLKVFQANATDDDRFRFSGIRSPQLRTAAYKVAIQQGTITQLPSSEFREIVETYTKIESVEKLHVTYMTGAINNMDKVRDNPDHLVAFLDSAMQDFLYGQEEAMLLIGEIIETPDFERWYEEIQRPEE